MAPARLYAAQPHLLRGTIVTVEIDITKNTLHAFSVVGLPDKAVDEARDRVSAALKNSGFTSPKSQNQKIVVSLSPADLKKEGVYYDLPIALGYLLADEIISFDPQNKLFLGELSLGGDVLPVRGVLALVEEAKRKGFTEVFVPEKNAREAAVVEGVTVYPVATLARIVAHLDTKKPQEGSEIVPQPVTVPEVSHNIAPVDFADICAQESAKRGLEIAAAGGHNIALYGPPGTGKTMLARALVGILPSLDLDSVLELSAIHSIAGVLREGELITAPPFRSPHHSASHVSIIGGGATPKPGEVTLAHRGVLFLDEFPEFEKRVIEALRQPLEDRVVSISRAKGTALFPAALVLIAAMNPCPCGYKTSKVKKCSCSASDLMRYERKLSGPITDRIDLWVVVPEVSYEVLGDETLRGESTGVVRERVLRARARSEKRLKHAERLIRTNAELSTKELARFANITPEITAVLNQSAEKLGLSARAYHRVIKLARTIADLDDKDEIELPHILEALQYRPKL